MKYEQPRPKSAWMAIQVFIIITVFCCFVPLGKLASLLIPLVAFVLAGYLYFRYEYMYLGFVWWLWFLAPLVRRMVDLKSEFTDPSPILLSPILASIFTLITLQKSVPRLEKVGGFPFVVAIFAVLYGTCVGLIGGSLQSVILKGLEFGIPILLGFHIYTRWRAYPLLKKTMENCFYWGTVVIGSYGVIQFMFAPPWDRAWLVNVTYDNVTELGSSFGIPEPLGIRVWSTLNSPLDFSMVMAACLLISLSSRHFLQIPVFGIGFLAFMLAQARTAWLGFFTGLLFVLFSLRSSLQIRFIILFSFILLLVIPLSTIEPFAGIISERLSTLSSLERDASATTRLETYQILIVPALTSFVGYGIGSVPNFGRILDSSILWILFSLGLFGGLFYFGGWLSLLYTSLKCKFLKSDPFAVATRAFVISSIPTMLLGPVIWSVSGTIIWSCLGISVAASKYYSLKFLSDYKM